MCINVLILSFNREISLILSESVLWRLPSSCRCASLIVELLDFASSSLLVFVNSSFSCRSSWNKQNFLIQRSIHLSFSFFSLQLSYINSISLSRIFLVNKYWVAQEVITSYHNFFYVQKQNVVKDQEILGFHSIPRDTKDNKHSGHVGVPNKRNNQNSFVNSTPTWPPWRQV